MIFPLNRKNAKWHFAASLKVIMKMRHQDHRVYIRSVTQQALDNIKLFLMWMELISPHGKWEWQPLNPHWPPAQILVQIQKHVYPGNIIRNHILQIKYISNIGWNTRANSGNIIRLASRRSFSNHREGWNNCLLPSYPGYFFVRLLPMKTIVENYNDDDNSLEF